MLQHLLQSGTSCRAAATGTATPSRHAGSNHRTDQLLTGSLAMILPPERCQAGARELSACSASAHAVPGKRDSAKTPSTSHAHCGMVCVSESGHTTRWPLNLSRPKSACSVSPDTHNQSQMRCCTPGCSAHPAMEKCVCIHRRRCAGPAQTLPSHVLKCRLYGPYKACLCQWHHACLLSQIITREVGLTPTVLAR